MLTFTCELDLFIEIAAADIGLPAIHDTIKDARPIAAEGQAVASEGISERRTNRRWRYFPFHSASQDFEDVSHTILRDSCARPKGAGSHQMRR